jgi:hypothetical protein
MVGFNTIFNNPFVGNRTKVSNNPKTETNFNTDPDEAIIIGEVIWKSNTKTFTAQNNPERRNSEEFFSAKNNLDFSKSNFSSSITNNVAQASVSNGFSMPSRLSGNDSKYGSFSSFNSPGLPLVGRPLATV